MPIGTLCRTHGKCVCRRQLCILNGKGLAITSAQRNHAGISLIVTVNRYFLVICFHLDRFSRVAQQHDCFTIFDSVNRCLQCCIMRTAGSICFQNACNILTRIVMFNRGLSLLSRLFAACFYSIGLNEKCICRNQAYDHHNGQQHRQHFVPSKVHVQIFSFLSMNFFGTPFPKLCAFCSARQGFITFTLLCESEFPRGEIRPAYSLRYSRRDR